MTSTERHKRQSAKRVSACVSRLLQTQPFFGSLALRLPIQADSSRETLGSDGVNIRYNPEWVSRSGADEITAAMARVVLACALKHHLRREDRDAGLWQKASQMATIPLIRDAGFRVPDDAEGWDAPVEKIYDVIHTERKEKKESEDEGQGEPPPVDPNGVGETMDAPTGHSESDSEGKGEYDPNGKPGEGKNTPPEHVPPPSAEQLRQEQERDWDEAMHQAMAMSKREGKEPGALKRVLESTHDSKEDYQTLLRRYMLAVRKTDYTWARPSYRHLDAGLYMPSISGEAMGELVIVLDVSGSVDEEMVDQFWTETRELCKEVKPSKVSILFVDTEIQKVKEYEGYSELPSKLKLVGGGGTDFRPAFKWLDERGEMPDLLIYFTDLMCTRWPETQPPFPVLWLNWGDTETPDDIAESYGLEIPPWGDRIDMDIGG